MSDYNGDLKDNEKDERYLQKEITVIDLPEVKDIPGQEHIHVPLLKEMADTTISSADEEGNGIFDDDEAIDSDSSVSETEKELLQRSSVSMSGEDDEARRAIMLENKDNEGELLNEQNDVSGDDLDVPGSELDNRDEKTGSEDEENNSYSWGQ